MKNEATGLAGSGFGEGKVSVLSFDLILIRQAYSIRQIFMALSWIIHEHHKCISLSPQLIPYRFAKVS